MKNYKLSILIPVYFNELNLEPTYNKLKEDVLSKLEMYEIIFVDDGSKDNSYEVIQRLQKNDNNIKAIKLSRNFGSHAAILAGLSVATGNCATIISADLQDPPEIIIQMLEKYQMGSKVVLAVRQDREEPLFQKMFSNTYYLMMRKFAIPNMPKGGFDCCLIDRKVIEVLNLMEEKNTTVMGQILWCGFKTDTIYYTRKKREIGKSRWTFSKKIKLLIDSLLGFSYFPIRFISFIGLLFFIISLVWLFYILFRKILIGITVEGWTSLMLVVLFSSGIIMLTLGILGEYVWRAFDAIRKRPPFIIEKED